MKAIARGGTPHPATRAAVRRLFGDPYVLYTATLVPVVVVVALGRRSVADLAAAIVLSVAAIGGQVALGRLPLRRVVRRPEGRALVRLAVPLVYVGLAVQLVGGPALPLLALFVPVVAGAAAIGTFEGWVTAGVAAAIYLVPEIGTLGSPAAIGLRGVTLAGISLILAFGTRRIVRALQAAAREARRATARERRRARQLAALEAVGGILASGDATPAKLRRVLRDLADRLGYPFLSVYLGDADCVRLVAQHGYHRAIPEFDPTMGVAGRVMRSRRAALVPDVASDPDYVPGTVAATSLVCAPLEIDGRFLGLLNVETSGSQRLDATDRSLVTILAGRIATALALGRDRQGLAARIELLRAIERFGRDVSATLAPDELSVAIIDAVGRVMPADTVAITLRDPRGGYAVRAARGVPAEVIGRAIGPGDGLAGRAIRDRAMVVDDTLDASKFPPSLRDLPMPPLTRGVAVPLVASDAVVGALTIGRTAADAEFTDLERDGLQLLAGHAALAVANASLHAEVAELAIRDGLTGLYNRRHLDEALDRLLAGRRRQRLSGPWQPLSVVIFDLDHFGAFNKEHGHQVGDAVLRAFADILRTRVRASDLVARMGGEEFLLVLDGAGREDAMALADEVRTRLASRVVEAADGRGLSVTVSAGCAELDPADPTREALLRTADVALSMAKRAGRDRVVAA